MLFSMVNGAKVKQKSFGFSSPESLFSMASLCMSSITSFLKTGSLSTSSKSWVFLPINILRTMMKLTVFLGPFFNFFSFRDDDSYSATPQRVSIDENLSDVWGKRENVF
jgi:hypothetical protein